MHALSFVNVVLLLELTSSFVMLSNQRYWWPRKSGCCRQGWSTISAVVRYSAMEPIAWPHEGTLTIVIENAGKSDNLVLS